MVIKACVAITMACVVFHVIGKPTSDFKRLKDRVKNGDVEAEYLVARCYSNGTADADDKELSLKKAHAIYGNLKSSENETIRYLAEYQFAKDFEEGLGVVRDVGRASKLFAGAIENGNVLAKEHVRAVIAGDLAVNGKKRAGSLEQQFLAAISEWERTAPRLEELRAIEQARTARIQAQMEEADKAARAQMEEAGKAARAQMEEAGKATRAQRAKEAAKYTLCFKDLYLGMNYEDALVICKAKFGRVFSGIKNVNGLVDGFELSREDVDCMFNTKGVSGRKFCESLLSSYPILEKFDVRREEIADVEAQEKYMREAERRAAERVFNGTIQNRTQAYAVGEAAGRQARLIADQMTKYIDCYYYESDKGFVLEIRPEQPERFFVLRKIASVNLGNFD